MRIELSLWVPDGVWCRECRFKIYHSVGTFCTPPHYRCLLFHDAVLIMGEDGWDISVGNNGKNVPKCKECRKAGDLCQ